jgi:hypothetical protein
MAVPVSGYCFFCVWVSGFDNAEGAGVFSADIQQHQRYPV